ncbi:hypothetical protein WQ56_06270 [Luteimonas sp. FCS-9]|nr:hypothetical protein WQ56_06270 [Luteimonas sp. FCS-9]
MPCIEELGPVDWARFVATCWDVRPVVYRQAGGAPYPTDAALHAAAAAAREAAAGETACRFVLDDRQLRQPGDWLPRGEDGSFDAYARRVLRAAGDDAAYALIVNEFHRHDARIFEAGRRFFRGLWAHVGLPATGAITTLFHGNYERTPVGVHKDRFSTFVFVLQGRKRMRFWPTRPWRDAVATRVDYAQHLADSFAIEVGPGDVLYWPSAYYHVGETIGTDVATSVNVGVPRDGHALRYEFDAIVRQADAEDAEDAAPLDGAASGGDPDRPPGIASALERARRLASPQALRSAAAAGYLSLLTGGGFAPPPPAMPPGRFDAGARVRLADPACPVAWMHDDGGALCGAAGHVRRVARFDDAAAALLRRLDGGEAIDVAALLAPFGDAPAHAAAMRRNEAHALLAWLVSTRALACTSAP